MLLYHSPLALVNATSVFETDDLLYEVPSLIAVQNIQKHCVKLRFHYDSEMLFLSFQFACILI